MILDAGILRGYPKERAELYGKPHLGARYTHGKAYEALSPRCCVCGSGTTGCHDKFHGGARLKAEWAWRSKVYEEAWWSGELLEVYEPHSPGLYEYGYWLITDRDGNEMIREGI